MVQELNMTNNSYNILEILRFICHFKLSQMFKIQNSIFYKLPKRQCYITTEVLTQSLDSKVSSPQFTFMCYML